MHRAMAGIRPQQVFRMDDLVVSIASDSNRTQREECVQSKNCETNKESCAEQHDFELHAERIKAIHSMPRNTIKVEMDDRPEEEFTSSFGLANDSGASSDSRF